MSISPCVGLANSAVNNAGAIVGSAWSTGDKASHAFLFQNGKMLDLNTVAPLPPGLPMFAAIGINNRGQIVALGDTFGPDSSSRIRTYLLTPIDQPVPADPVPEPSVLALFTVVALAGGGRRALRLWHGRRSRDTEGCLE